MILDDQVEITERQERCIEVKRELLKMVNALEVPSCAGDGVDTEAEFMEWDAKMEDINEYIAREKEEASVHVEFMGRVIQRNPRDVDNVDEEDLQGY